jgi:hypothetical protein
MIDMPLLIIALLLLATVGAWLIGWFVYPFGLLVLLAALTIRSIQIHMKTEQ